jgi:hypothetical protein
VPPQSYSELAQYRLACQLWEKERQLWDERERTRVAGLEEAISKGEAFGGFYAACCFAIIGGAWYVGAHYGAGSGWGIFIGGMTVFGTIGQGLEKIERWRRRKELKPVPFWQPEPVYIQSPPNQDPPPRQESPKPPVPDSGKVTTLRQAIEILGVPPKTTRSECQKAYRTLIAQYHPDKVAHLAPEFRKMAAEKSLQLNLAIQYIESYLS